MLQRQHCPKCGQLNAPEATQCAHCSAPLDAVCPRCGTRRPWYVPRCARCEAGAADEGAFAALFRRPPGRRVGGRYLLSHALSTGRVSAVYRAGDAERPALVYAVKELSPIAFFRPDERRELESRYYAQLQRWLPVKHPAVAGIVDAFAEHDRYYVVMEHVAGRSMREIIDEQRFRITPRLAANWGAQLCDLLEYLHGLHPARHVPFLAPAHVMVTAAGEVKLVDLGLTCPFLPAGECGPHGSTPGYAAPELEGHPPTTETDQFALGRLLYALLVGRLLERGIPRNLPLQRAVPDIPLALVRSIARAAHRDADRRFERIEDLRRALWDEARGPLEPIAGWDQAARREAPRPSRDAASPAGPSMADLGFEPDPRFGPRTAGAAQREQLEAEPRPSPAPQPARLTIRPQHLRVDDLRHEEARRVVLNLHNVGPVPVEGRFVSRVEWVKAPSKVFRLPVDKEAKAIIRVTAQHLASGETTEAQALLVDTNAGRQWVAVTADVPAGPVMAVSPDTLDFGDVEGEGERALPVTLRNEGTAPFAGAIHAQVDWLRVPRGDFRCMPGAEVAMQVYLRPERLPQGPQHAEHALLIDSDAGQRRIGAHAWLRRPRLEVATSHLDVGELLAGQTTSLAIPVRNGGDGPLSGRARSLVEWLQVHPEEFSCGPGELIELTVVADATGLGAGPVSLPEAVRIQTTAGAVTLGVDLQVLAPRLVLNTTYLEFGEITHGGATDRPVSLRNAGSAPLHATLRPLADWVRLGAEEVEAAPGESVEVSVHADTSVFPHGVEIADQPVLRVTAGTVMRDVTASLSVLRPALRVDPPELDFGFADAATPVPRALTIANDGTGRLAWHAVSDASWVELQPAAGVCGAGESQELRLTAYALALEEQTEAAEATLVINSDGGRAKVPLRLAVANPHLACDTTFLDLGESVNYEDVSASLRVFNYGLGRLSGSVRAGQTWLAISRSSFECETGRSEEILVSTDMAEFPEGTSYGSGTLHMESNGGEADVEVGVTVLLEPRVRATETVRLRAAPGSEAGAQGRLVLSNDGLAPAHVELVPSLAQIVLSRDFCDVKPGKRIRIGVRWEGAASVHDVQATIDVRLHDGTHLRVPVILEEAESDETTDTFEAT